MTASRATVLLLAVLAAGCAGITGGLSDLERTWAGAVVALPSLGTGEALVTTMDSRDMQNRLARLPQGASLPVVVYAHGCTGIGNYDFFRRLADSGFVVVAPDSFAREWRPLQCDPESRTGGINVFVYDFRLAEISYALDRLWQRPWADWTRMVLAGASEGAVAVALYRGDEFRGRVIAQWTCGGAPHVRGLAATPGEAVLAVVGADDPWYCDNPGDCGAFLGSRSGSESLLIPAGRGHNVFGDAAGLQAILNFIRAAVTP